MILLSDNNNTFKFGIEQRESDKFYNLFRDKLSFINDDREPKESGNYVI